MNLVFLLPTPLSLTQNEHKHFGGKGGNLHSRKWLNINDIQPVWKHIFYRKPHWLCLRNLSRTAIALRLMHLHKVCYIRNGTEWPVSPTVLS